MSLKQVFNSTLRRYKNRTNISCFPAIETCQPCNRFQIVPISQQNICFCSSLRLKSFYETENKFLYHALSDTPSSDTVALNSEEAILNELSFTTYLNKDWRSSNATDILKAFKAVKEFCVQHNLNFTDPRFDTLVDGLMDHCQDLSDKQLLDLLTCICEYPVCTAFNSRNYHDMWSCLDDICCWRINSWDTDLLFKFADVWYKLKLGRIADFIFEMLNRLVKKAPNLSKDQLVRIFFCFNVCRGRPIDFEYEDALQHKIGEMNVDEMAVVAVGYFKSQSKIKLIPIMETMAQEVTHNAMGIHEISLTAIMKVLRFSQPIKILPVINQMMKSLYPELDRFSEVCCLHVALLATGLQTFHGNILRKCSQKLVDNLPNTRLKDIERILNVITMFNFDPKTKPDIYDQTYRELHKDSRIAEINQFPRCLASALNYLSLRGIYSYKLMDMSLDYDFIEIHFGKAAKLLPRQLFVLDACIDIECQSYVGNRLPSDLKYKAAKWLTEWAPTHDQYKKISPRDRLFLDTKDAVKKMVGSEELLLVEHVLPHFSIADIIICKDTKSGAFVKPMGFEKYQLGDVMKPFNDGTLKWFAIVVMTWNHTMRETSASLGTLVQKQRHLELVGYHPVMVVWNQFIPLSPEEKVEYILEKLT